MVCFYIVLKVLDAALVANSLYDLGEKEVVHFWGTTKFLDLLNDPWEMDKALVPFYFLFCTYLTAILLKSINTFLNGFPSFIF